MRWGRHSRPLVIAHRGASAHALENTLTAFRLARDQGADGVELDVMRCATGEVVVFHDDDLSRLAGRPDSIRHTSWATLRDVRLEGGERIPRLEDVLAETDGLLINVELKTPPAWRERARDDGLARAVAELLRGANSRALVSSFDPLLLLRFRRALESVPLGLLFSSEQSRPLREAWSAPLIAPLALHPEAALVDAVALRDWRGRGYLVHVWTVDDAAELRAMAALGADAVITNRPGETRAVLDDCVTMASR
jgi:glycerophosphoryl diester phosphodiesterase